MVEWPFTESLCSKAYCKYLYLCGWDCKENQARKVTTQVDHMTVAKKRKVHVNFFLRGGQNKDQNTSRPTYPGGYELMSCYE